MRMHVLVDTYVPPSVRERAPFPVRMIL